MNFQTLTISDICVGEKLPSLEIPVTSKLIVGGAIASRDFTPVHHEKNKAQEAGLPDIFMNILTSNGLMMRFVTDWSGPGTTVKKIDIKLGAPNLPGFLMTINGQVNSIDRSTGRVEVSVEGENNVWGMHMSGVVCIELPLCNSEQGLIND